MLGSVSNVTLLTFCAVALLCDKKDRSQEAENSTFKIEKAATIKSKKSCKVSRRLEEKSPRLTHLSQQM